MPSHLHQGDMPAVGNDPSYTHEWMFAVGRRARETSVRPLMRTDVMWLSADTPVTEALQAMLRADARVALVANAGTRRWPAGTVRREQLVSSDHASSRDDDSWLTALAVGIPVESAATGSHNDGRERTQRLVGDVMVPGVHAVTEDASIAGAAAKMSLYAIRDLVVGAGEVQGLLSASDICDWIATQLDGALAVDTPDAVDASDAPTPHDESIAPAPRVLVVEDDRMIAGQLAEVLAEEGYHTVHAADGRVALDVLSRMSDKPRIILLDLVMPNMDGWQFRRAQLRDATLSTIPTVVMTAFAEAAETPDLGSVSVLSKPLRLEPLLNVLEEHCR